MGNQTIKTGKLYRNFTIDTRKTDEKKRTVELSFSSESPVERYFGTEILSHDKKHVDMGFISSGCAPLIYEHYGRQIGVIESAEIGKDKKGRAVVRFGNSDDARAEFEDVKDGIRTNISVGYRIRKMVLTEDDEEKGRTYLATDWMPLEISTVSIPADLTVGIGRADNQEEFETEIINTNFNRAAPAQGDVKIMEKTEEQIRAELEAEQSKKLDQARNNAVADIREIVAVGEAHDMGEAATKFINEGKSAREFKDYVLAEMAKRGSVPVKTPEVNIGLTGKEIKSFSFLRAIRALSHPGNVQFAKAAEFEFECSKAVEDLTRKTPKGIFVPSDVLMHGQRDMNTQVDSQGGYLVDNILAVGSFIEKLENNLAIKALGSTILRDLVGDLSIPKQTGGGTAYWIGEGEDLTESGQALGQVGLRPHSVGAYTDLTRKFMLQSSLDAESWVRNDLALRLALAIDLAALTGSGAAGQPMGVLNTTGIGTKTLATANTVTHGEACDIAAEIAIDNALAGNLAYTANATIAGKMQQTDVSTSTGRWVLEGDKTSNGYRFVMSNQVTAKYIIFGNWSDLILAYWSGVDINVDTATLSKSGGIRVVLIQDVDVAIRHAESFAYGYKA